MSSINLPPGFRFHPNDEELIVHFLYRKAARLPCHPDIIPDIELYRYDPWELNGKALEGENQWYFFSHRTQNPATANGYWKPIGVDDTITSGSRTVGMKKSLIFYVGESPFGIKTNWVMHEFHLLDCATSSKSSKKRGKPKTVSKDWILCRVHERDSGSQSSFCDEGTELSCLDEVFLSLDDDLDEISLPN
ncbi:NAC domain-containing protein 104-like [Magnolia sinica]|uniref:NAC domain-containing protein 104-like n=1 Tax=Magnolia sinica TaxID=86752 RepID=UPI00265B3A9B|nr:NAC domain-containing protein 104-like [Magnolia sinica]